jgi:intein-encoded DNA endonuclease-like protein
MGYTAAQVEEIAGKLRAMPVIEPPPKDLTKQEVVKMLAKEIKSLQKRGYTLAQIATSLKGEGLDISTPTLKSYLQRVKSPAKVGGKSKVNSSSSSTSSSSASNLSKVDGHIGGKAIASKEEHQQSNRDKLTPRPDSDEL